VKALLLIDIQNDFMPGGTLAVEQGDEVVPVANAIKPHFDLVVVTMDWHPCHHVSFASNHPGREAGDQVEVDTVMQTLWPDHCVQNTPGASLHSGLDVAGIDHVVHKGVDPDIDSYSCFFDNEHLRDTGLDAYLRERGVREVGVAGVAMDYCVRFSALDARALGYDVSVVIDGCRGVELAPGDIEAAAAEMRAAGCKMVLSGDL
jgi:nicotinamidase/pyrazinamidase